jgi:hypothetical protein
VPRWFPDLSSALSGTPRPIVAQPGNRKPRSFGTTKQANHLPQAELQTPAKGPPLGMLLIAASHPCTVPLPRQILPSASFPIFDERYIGVLPPKSLEKTVPFILCCYVAPHDPDFCPNSLSFLAPSVSSQHLSFFKSLKFLE